MVYARIKYLASVFWDAESIVANPTDISSLMKDFSPYDLLPTTASENSPSGFIKRMAFQKSNGEIRIIISGKRLDIFKLPIDAAGSNMGSLEEFSSNALIFFDILLKYFGRQGNRLALIQEGLLNKMELIDLESACINLFKLPAIYDDNSPFEWDWRNACKLQRSFGASTDYINTITKLSRSKMKLIPPKIEKDESQIMMDTISYSFDLNTSADNTQMRFGVSEVKSFFHEAPLWHSELANSIFKFILGKET